jgi:nucleotide-binding universal stress UspA family protein
MSGPVVAGVDGSPAGMAAAEAAAEEARLREVPLRLVHAYHWPTAPVGGARLVYEPDVDAMRNMAERFMADAASRARSVAPDIDVTTDLLWGEALKVLVRLSHKATLIVVGSRGLGSFTGLLVGSVALHLVAHTHCPVEVVRGRPRPSGDVLLGIDGSPAAQPSVDFAFDEAALRGCGVTAVHAWSEWTTPAQPPPDRSMPYAYEAGMLRDDGERLLAESLAGSGERQPDVPVERRTVRGRPRETLIEGSKNARLLVVGARGRGGFAGLLLGSVSQAALHHADCPVAVVPYGR